MNLIIHRGTLFFILQGCLKLANTGEEVADETSLESNEELNKLEDEISGIQISKPAGFEIAIANLAESDESSESSAISETVIEDYPRFRKRPRQVKQKRDHGPVRVRSTAKTKKYNIYWKRKLIRTEYRDAQKMIDFHSNLICSMPFYEYGGTIRTIHYEGGLFDCQNRKLYDLKQCSFDFNLWEYELLEAALIKRRQKKFLLYSRNDIRYCSVFTKEMYRGLSTDKINEKRVELVCSIFHNSCINSGICKGNINSEIFAGYYGNGLYICTYRDGIYNMELNGCLYDHAYFSVESIEAMGIIDYEQIDAASICKVFKTKMPLYV